MVESWCVTTIAVEKRLRRIYSRFNVINRMGLVRLFIDDFILKILNSPVLENLSENK